MTVPTIAVLDVTPAVKPAVWTLTLRRLPEVTAPVRRIVAASLTDCPRLDDVTLIVSEIVANSIVHSAGETFTLTITPGDDRVRIHVADEGRGCDSGGYEGELSESGRGLQFIIANLATDWGHVATVDGTETWAEVAW